MILALRLLWRDWRGRELGVLLAALLVAVAIVTAIALFADRLQQGIEAQSSQFLAADRVLRSPRPVDRVWLEKADAMGLRSARVVTFSSMVYAGDDVDAAMQLASVKAVSSTYPLKGVLETAAEPFGEAQASLRGPGRGEAWIDSRLAPLLGIAIGDRIVVGDASLRVTRVIRNEPDRGSAFSGFGPRVMISVDDLAATHIIQPGSRVQYRYLFTGPAADLDRFRDALQPLLQPSQRWLDIEDSQPRLYRSLQRARSFLMLAGAVGVGLAGVAIAMAARRYSERHYDYVAVMKSLGASGARVLGLYLAHLLALALVAIVIGWAIGWSLQEVVILSLRGLVELDAVPGVSVMPFAIGAVTALVCLLAFALPALVSMGRVSPLRVLRRDLQPLETGVVTSAIAGVAGVALLMLWYSGDIKLTVAVVLGVAVTLLLMGVMAAALLRAGAATGMQASGIWQLARSSLRRRRAANTLQIVIFSLTIMLLLILALVRSSLIEDWRVQLPEGTPNHFLINVAQSQVKDVRGMLDKAQVQREPVYPMVRGRLVSVNNDSVRERLRRYDPDSTGDALNRELNITWSAKVPDGNRLLAGQWWSSQSRRAEVSIESGLAKRLGVTLGDHLAFAIGSEPLQVTVTSIRELDWDSMKPNFYMVMPAHQLDRYPATYITSFYLPPDRKPFLNQLLHRFPTLSVIEMDQVIAQIRAIVDQISAAVAWVLSLVAVSAILVLIAAVQASLDSRYQESAVLRTLGARRALVLGSLVAEFSVMGALAGLLAACSTELAVYYLQDQVLDMTPASHPWVWLAGPVLGALVIGCSGYLSCRRVVNTAPARILLALG